jgi:hypothetical protein
VTAVYVALAINKRRKVKRKCWTNKWVTRCDRQGAYAQLIRELQLEDAQQFRNFTRMSAVEVHSLVNTLGPTIGNQNTAMSNAISVEERVIVNTSLSGNRQVINAMLICYHCNCMLAPIIFSF